MAEIMAGDWNDLVARWPGGSIYQTSMWAEAKGERTAARVVRTGCGDHHQAGAQLLVRRLAPGVRAAYVPYGPLYSHRPSSIADTRAILSLIEAEATVAGCAVVLVQPARNDVVTAEALEVRGYRQAPVDVTVSATLEVALERPHDEIFRHLSKSRRQNVRRAKRRGVVVEIGSSADLPTLARLHSDSADRHGFLALSPSYLQRQWDALSPGGHLQLYTATIDGTVVAAGTMLGFGELAEFKMTGWDASERASTAYVNEALNWAMMSAANEAGYRIFDLGGLPRELAYKALRVGVGDALRGTGSAFKHGWGGQLAIHSPTYEKILTSAGHVTYGLGSRLLGDDRLGGRLVNMVRRT